MRLIRVSSIVVFFLSFWLLWADYRQLFSFGTNGFGQLGITSPNPVVSTTPRNIIKISNGAFATLYMSSTGTVYSAGQNANYNELGQNNGGVDVPVPLQIPSITNAVDIGTGDTISVILCSNGTILTFGAGNNGELGTGIAPQTIFVPSPLSVPPLAKMSVGRYRVLTQTFTGVNDVWGYNANGQLGLGDTTMRAAPTILNGIVNVQSMAAQLFQPHFGFYPMEPYLSVGVGPRDNLEWDP
jgi:alpha-tubulin suppressor-like RCC1 family protein